MTTKEQERKALEKIRKIVEELGENSYVATAFEGCFEVAEENIDNDWACSMKQRVASADSETITAQQNFAKANRKIEMLQDTIKCLQKRNSELEVQNGQLNGLCNEYEDRLADYEEAKQEVIRYLGHRSSECEKKMAGWAEQVVDLSECPADIAYKDAVKWYKETREERKKVQHMIHLLLATNK